MSNVVHTPDVNEVARAAAHAVAQVPGGYDKAAFTPRFAVYDDGEVIVECGDDMIRLDARAADRLYHMMRGQKLAETVL